MLKSWFHVSNSLQNGHISPISPDAFFSTTKGVANIIYTADSCPTSKVSSLSDWIYQNDFKIQYPSAYRCFNICQFFDSKQNSQQAPFFSYFWRSFNQVWLSESQFQKFKSHCLSSEMLVVHEFRFQTWDLHGPFMDLPNPSNFPLSSQCLSNLGIMNHDPCERP